jgi:methionine-R-sulfoxide reductase
MKKNLRSVLAIAAVAAGVTLVAVLSRPPEANAQSQATTVSESAVVLDVNLERAVSRASATPEEYDYDLSERIVYAEDADLQYPIELPLETWREMLTDFEFYILRQKGTERAFTHPLNDNKQRGIYYSRATGQPLFHSDDKYDSRTGWPSFSKPINPDAIVYIEDNTLFARRIEVVDSLSGSHLGHVFPDGPRPTGQRYCINGAALVFVAEGEEPPPNFALQASQ